MKKELYFTTGSAMIALMVASGTGIALAQDSGMPDIIVTAQKREQKLNDVGISIVAATGEQLQSAGVTDVTQLAKIAPGFSVGNTYSGYKVFSLRGINFNAVQISAPPAVSTYIDEAILPFSAMTEGLLLDVERVEVLKGPQGTLFGQNATGGSINVIAAKPTADAKAGFDVEVNQFGQIVTGGFVSGPISDTLLARLSGSTTQFGGYQKGYFLNRNKNGDQNKGAARLLLDWSPTERIKVSINLNANYDHSELIQSTFGGFAPIIAANTSPILPTYPLPNDNRDADITPGINTRAHNRMYQAVARIDYDVSDALTFTSITNYIDFKSRSYRDGDGTALDLLNYQPVGNVKTFNQEVRLTGKALASRLTYIAGVNYEKDKILDVNNNYFPGYSALPVGASLSTADKVRNRSIGVFGNLDFEILPGLTLTGGARYTKARQSLRGCTTGNELAALVLGSIANAFRGIAGLGPTDAYVAGQCMTINDNVPVGASGQPDYLPIFGDVKRNEDNVSWRAGVNYKPSPDTLVYALVSRGYKAGLFSVQQNLVNSTLQPVKQEKLTSYEVGTKLSLVDRAVQLNLSAFYYDYRDKQFFTYIPNAILGANALLVNVPKSKVKGGEAELVLNPADGLTLRGAVTYINTEVGPFSTFDFQSNPLDVTGSEFNFAAPWSGTFDAQYDIPVANGRSVYLGAGGFFNSRTYSNLGETNDSRIPAYAVFDARIGMESDKGWKAGLFVRNLTNKYYYTAVFPTGDTNGRFSGLPRTFGAVASFRF